MGKLVVLSVVVAVLALLIGERFYALRNTALGFRELTQNHLPNCELIKGLEIGAEDITVIEYRLAVISTGLKYPGMPRLSDAPGKIYVLNLASGKDPTELHIKGDFDAASFGPHGISVYTDEDGSRYLFVVNHPHDNSQVEIFQYIEEENTLVHMKTIKHELLHNVNDIVAVGVENFYATNDHYFTNEYLKLPEMLFSLPWCNVVYYSPEAVREVAGGFFGANGINISPDRKHLYVSDLMNHQIVVLIIQKDNVLSRVKEVAVGSLCDNIEVESKTGDLWMGCHPNGVKFFLRDPNDPPGSEVIRIQNIHSDEPVVTQVYSDNGSVLIGSSVATPYRGKLLIGSVYQKALMCDLE
ncbi:serum paraoxonase/arylesterase 2-like [Clarias gariepinus]|uniref:serum paraoxonase/arylesterase 2-like n=1 Tax=Clarias gariepinus TaxID=13013 RepID=UPI00234CCE70|nr:serum paraoxonase/arylesterase 2-like [Clarias gariepinus]